MLIGSCVLTGAAFGRMPLMHSPFGFYGGIDALILPARYVTSSLVAAFTLST